ncbi:hypothetical protein NQ318_017589 [Aromia moschata]|uniref:Receptor ligand binding region domain-containing protein n=1 Tax=Aromia moschata TaxID=1265417 RepID=A0AAV8Z0B0_9CUCU|nr:hypothetical protein NQ318_017589 [Aromia moschata]
MGATKVHGLKKGTQCAGSVKLKPSVNFLKYAEEWRYKRKCEKKTSCLLDYHAHPKIRTPYPSRSQLTLVGSCCQIPPPQSQHGILKDKSKYPTLTRMSYCQCRLKKVFSSIFKQFRWKHIALILDRSDLFSVTVGKILEDGLKRGGLLAFVKRIGRK